MTLEGLCATLGPLAALVLAPRGLDVAVTGGQVFDRFATAVAMPNAVVLAAGIETHTHDLLDLIATVGRAGGAAVVFKGVSAPPAVVLEAAQRARVALLQARNDVAWGDLYALIAACVSQPEPDAATEAFADAQSDLYALADVTAALAGGAVTIEDAGMRLLAYSRGEATGDDGRTQGILARSAPEKLLERLRVGGGLARIAASAAVVPISVEGFQPRRVVSVRAGGAVVGYVWLVEETHAPDEHADAALQEAARIAAPLLARERMTTRVKRSVRGEWLARLLTGDGPPAVLAAQLGIPATAWFTVAAYAAPRAKVDAEPCAVRTADLIALHLRALHDDIAVVDLDSIVYALMIDLEQPERARIRGTVGDCMARLRRTLGEGACAGLGGTVVHVEEVAEARASADRALAISAELRPGELVDVEDVRGEAFVLALREFAARELYPLSHQLAGLFEYDAANTTDYVPTLRAYLDAMGDVVLAAQRLHVHPNTLRYRMRRVAALSDLDLASADQRFALECQLRLLAR